MRAGFRVGEGQCADQHVLVDATQNGLQALVVMVTQQRGSACAEVHGVAHRGGGAAVACDGLDDHGGAQVALAAATQRLGHGQTEQAHRGKRLEVLARIDVVLVAVDRVRAHRALAHGDQLGLQGQLFGAEHPLRAPFCADTGGGEFIDGVHVVVLV
ncbi:hypothetical protein SDC9_206981 [bioreactor metagenome]|uniref:Uncharacterized protein n=1 Tax=bioreactor metagenome TaxID=1076179 RepID=A0A645J7Y9_9ZZZZ